MIISRKGIIVMKYLKKLMVFSLFMLMSFGGKIAAYTYTLVNETGQDVKVRLLGSPGALNEKDDLIKKGETRKFYFGGGKSIRCLDSIKILRREAGEWIDQIQWGLLKKKFPILIRPLKWPLLEGRRMSSCGDRNLFLRIDPKTGYIRAMGEFVE